MEREKELYVGIDLDFSKAMVSLYQEEMDEPQTISTVFGEEKYQIPTAVFQSKQGNYFYGEEAIRRESNPDGEFYDNLYREALRETSSTLYRNLLVQFLRRLVQLKERYEFTQMELYLAITVPEITQDVVELFEYVRSQFELPTERFMLMDYGESFFAHTYHQDPSIWLHDVALFDYERERIRCMLLHRDRGSGGHMQMVSVTEKNWTVPDTLRGKADHKDAFFANVLREAFEKRIVSGVYFVGDEFDGRWMRESLQALGPHRRAFQGKNLYTRGACLAVYRERKKEGWNYFYNCSYKMQGEISVKVQKGQDSVFLQLITVGKNWFSPVEDHYLIYDGRPVLDAWIRTIGISGTRIQMLEFPDLPKRPAKTIRLRLRAVPVSGKSVRIEVADDGFGELYESSGKTWSFSVDF